MRSLATSSAIQLTITAILLGSFNSGAAVTEKNGPMKECKTSQISVSQQRLHRQLLRILQGRMVSIA